MAIVFAVWMHALDRQRILIAAQVERRRHREATSVVADARDPCEALLEIPDQIVHGFDADRQPDGSGTHAGRAQLLVVELTMRRAGRMDDQALGIADVGEVRPQGDAANEVLSRRAAAAAVEGEHRARAARQVFVDERPVAARRQARIGHVRREVVRLEKARDGRGILDMAGHPQRQRLQSLQEQEGIERAQAGAEVAQGLGAELHQIAVGAERLVELEPVICRRGSATTG